MTVTVTSKHRPSLTCCGCKATLQFELADLKFMRVDSDYIDPGSPAAGIECPDCSTVTVWSKAPQAIVRRLQAQASERRGT